MTKDAQSALRRTMEKEGRSTRFCLICNYISRIIEPITSRCAKFRFKPLSDAAIKGRIQMICESEKLTLNDDEAFKLLIDSSEGDMRKAITTLQSCSRLSTDINQRDIFEVTIFFFVLVFFFCKNRKVISESKGFFVHFLFIFVTYY
jgi:replication factor C subunit 2/4